MRNLVQRKMLLALALVCGAGLDSAQIGHAQGSPAPDVSSFAGRAATAKTVRVITSILGISPGMPLDDSRDILEKLADPKTPPAQEGGDQPGRDKEKGGEDEGGKMEVLWKLAPGASADYQWVFIQANKEEKIVAVFGYCWPNRSIPFDQIGDVTKAPFHSADEVAWDSLKPKTHYRIVATGAAERATQVTISLMAVQTFGVHRPGED